jgi:hypothetical protein
MFNKISASNLEHGNTKLDPGHLAELLLFYKEVNIVINQFMLDDLLNYCDFDTLSNLMSTGRLNIYLRENHFGGADYNENRYNIETIAKTNESYRSILFESINKKTRNSLKSLKLHDKLLSHIKPFRIPLELLNKIRGDFKNEDFVMKCLEKIISTQIANYKIPAKTRLKFEDGELFNNFETLNLVTNFDFISINKVFENLGITFRISPPTLLLDISSAFLDLYISDSFKSNVLSSSFDSQLINLKFDDLRIKNEELLRNISLFQEILLPNYKSVSEIIRSKEKSFSDLLILIEKADKFKDWLCRIDEEPNIIAEYYNKISEKTWLEKAPAKTIRFLLFTATGTFVDLLTGLPIASPALSAMDTFLIEQLASGWKPNQFIDNDLKSFLE